ncbi:hypothetical protein JL101_001950 [Skermanella rosea]|uniref:hypothetical protein n=1 Tax=Skermanella rosea TaxID=1817965 RepID=UPI0019324BD1|nr:hypothetical protein [Skermanella rosea]UEM06739.1 hypothetical protein JL101_001950 [Skermanella rosea]
MTGTVPPAVAAAPAGAAGTGAGAAASVAAPPPQPAGEATLEKLPEKLKNLIRTIVLSGTVVEQTADGGVKVRTQAGDVSLKTPAPLPPDRPVSLQIPPGNPPLKALVFMLGPPAAQAPPPPPAQVPQQVPPQNAAPAPPAAPPQATKAPPPPAAAAVNQHPMATAAAPAPAPAPQVGVGTVIPATVVSSSPPPLPPPVPAAAPAKPAAPPPPARTAAPPPLPTQVVPTQTVPMSPAPAPSVPASPAPTTAPAQGTSAPVQGTPAPAMPGAPQAPARAGQAAAQTLSNPPNPPSAGPAPGPAQQAPALERPAQQGPAPQASPRPALTMPPPAPSGSPPAGPATSPAFPQAPPQTPEGIRQPAQPLPMPLLKSGTPVEIRVIALPPQPQPASTAATPAPVQPPPPQGGAATLPATVAGTTNTGQPILTTDLGVLVLNTRVPLPPGTQVAVSLPAPPPAADQPFDALRGRDWPALQDALDVLARTDPAGARALANAILPQVNPRLAATLLAFAGHVKKGDARSWLGEPAAQALESLGRRELVEKLGEDFKQLAQQASEPLPGDWRAYSIPFSDGTELSRINLYVRPPDAEEVDEDGENAAGNSARANRFLIDLTLSRLGELQLDGLVRPRRFDLILRTHLPLPPEMRREIGRIFHDSVEALGMTGGVSFQAGTQGWVEVQPGRAGSVGFSA